MTKLVFFDLETGGLDPDRHAIIQIAAAAAEADSLNVIESFERKIRFPKEAAEPEALQVNHYDPAVWEQEAKHPDEVAQEFAAFLSNHATRKCVSKKGSEYTVAEGVAYNGAAFDGPFLKSWFKRRNAFMPMWPSVFDVMQLVKWYYLWRDDKPKNYRLETVAAHLGVWSKEHQYHDARDDVAATVEVTRKCLSCNK